MASEKSEAILDEMVELSVRLIKILESVAIPHSVRDQLTRAVTSIGANFSEAQDASSKKDFLNKIYIAKKEASETKYWLAIVSRLVGSNNELENIRQDVQGFAMMLQKIVNTTREGNRT
jgi:four helix bundle protein